jgi:hypothetical protein
MAGWVGAGGEEKGNKLRPEYMLLGGSKKVQFPGTPIQNLLGAQSQLLQC